MRVFSYKIRPALPERLSRLEELAHNLWWCWDHDAIALFRRLDQTLWEQTGHNPVQTLGEVDQPRLAAASREEGFLAHLDHVLERFDKYMARQKHGCDDDPEHCTAYFATEFGVTECLPIYSGGLAVLAGDHLKSASDLGYSITGVGLLYRRGYFQQYLNEAGWQQETYVNNDFHSLPLLVERSAQGQPATIELSYPDGPVRARIWRAQVGRVPLYLLDSDLDDNRPEDRGITTSLYGGDSEMRIRQEILLGMGGVRALDALGIHPDVCHMNEGHSAFLGLERIRRLMKREGLSFGQAHEAVAATNVFTSHTPVPAGIDVFSPGLMERYFGGYAERLGLSWDDFMALGQENPAADGGFSMAVLAVRLSNRRNAVSQLHGRVARRMWRGLWPQVPQDEVPISAVTNGVHFSSWISHDMATLFDRYLGPRWREEPADPNLWREVEHIPADELWRTHEIRRERLIAFVRRRLQDQLRRRGAPPRDVALAEEALYPDALTLGFGRRFATYKRAALLLRDTERLRRLLTNPERPVQLIMAGKAHPQDDAGKALIQQMVQLAREEAFRPHLVFVENYDITVARYLVQGVDVWLNTPRRPNEACGTSGMKAMANGALNLSTLDGWWDEAFEPQIGWSIGQGEEYEDENYQDEVESQALFEILEKEVVPLFFRRENDGLPRAWMGRMRASMSRLGARFNAHRMVMEYAESYYHPALRDGRQLLDQGAAGARSLAAWKEQMAHKWSQVRIERVEGQRASDPRVGQDMAVEADICLGEIAPEDVLVELYHGRVDTDGEIPHGQPRSMEWVESSHSGTHLFRGSVPFRSSGLYGYGLRLRPRYGNGDGLFEPGLILWARWRCAWDGVDDTDDLPANRILKMSHTNTHAPTGWRNRLRVVIFEADTPAGKAFDVGLLVCIVLSVMAVLLESVASIRSSHGVALRNVEWAFTVLFTIEYGLRLICVGRPTGYAFSFFGMVDLLAVVPTYLSLFLAGPRYSLIVIRALRLLRIFRVLKLVRFLGEANLLMAALKASSRKIIVFLGAVLTIVVIIGSAMYLIEGEASGFTSIPAGIYWAIVTMTTVGYGDIAPITVAGKFLASALMITGYGVIAVPTGIVTAELTSLRKESVSTRSCPECASEGHDPDADFCKFCGTHL